MTKENYLKNELGINYDFHFMKDLVSNGVDRIVQMSEDYPKIYNIPTGFPEIDIISSGLQVGDLTVIASRPSIGKSALALSIADNVSSSFIPVAIFSMELNKSQIFARLVASRSRVNINNGDITPGELNQLVKASVEFIDDSGPVAISDLRNITLDDVREKSIRLKQECGYIGIVIIDSLQMMKGCEIDNLLGLKSLANELNCHVILTSQVGDSVEFRSNKRPTMFDVRDIIGIEYIPDTLIFLYRDDYYTKDKCENPGIAELNFIRQRTGPSGVVVKLVFIEKIPKFESIVRSYF